MKNIFRLIFNKLRFHLNKPIKEELNQLKEHFYIQNNQFIELNKSFELIFNNRFGEWLYRNKDERMDASLDFFHPVRRNFHIDRYKFALEYTENKVVADIACGTGYGSEIIAIEGKAKKIYGIDISEETIMYAKDIHGNPNIEFICTSADDTKLRSNSIDILVSFETLEHVLDERKLLSEFYRILKPDGLLLISTPNEWPLEIAKHHHKYYNFPEFKRVLSEKFNILDIYNQNSGHDWDYNRGQKRGILRTNEDNFKLAECYIAVCTKIFSSF